MDDRLGTTLHTGLLVAVVALAAWLSGLPMLFPSLGPSAFVLATWPRSDASTPRRVIGGHVIGVVAGLVAYHLLAGGAVVTSQPAPGSLTGLGLVASGVLATVLTAGGMLAARVRHPPACATTLIVSLGLLSTLLEGTIVVLSVVVLVVTQLALLRGAAALDGLRERSTATGQ